MDQDTQAVVGFLGAALVRSGLTQGAFATALGTSTARLSTYLHGRVRPSAHFCCRADRIGRALGEARHRGLVTPPVLAAELRLTLRDDLDEDWAWRGVLQSRDHLRWAFDHDAPVEAWEAAPGPLGSRQWDVLLAVIIAHEYADRGQGAPGWTEQRPLSQAWVPPHPFLSPDRVRAATPTWLSEFNVFVPARDLTTA